MAELLALAEAADQADMPDGMSIPEELARREKRLAADCRGENKIEARVKERKNRRREYQQKLAARAEHKAHRQEAPGRPPAPPSGRSRTRNRST